jgi:hypothetical protein
MNDHLTSATDSRLRRLAQRHRYVLRRSRWRRYSIDNLGGYMIVDPETNFCVAGERYDLEPGFVEAWLSD